jgi:hypothetical protein
MKISTKTVASLLLVTAVAAAVPGVTDKLPGRKRFRHGSQFDRLLQRHDRKGELRAEVLGMDVRTFREKMRHKTLEEVAKQRGFKTVREFRIALLGKLKHELRLRGWSLKKIEQYVLRRSTRVS